MPLLLMTLWLAVLPKGVILVKGATPSASDATTPVPENGSVDAGRYRNAYFGVSYPVPAGWLEQPAGPPPSDSGAYVLTQFALFDPGTKRVKANVLVTAQDLFFTPTQATSAHDFIAIVRQGLPSTYRDEGGSATVTISGRPFARFAYTSARAGLHWRVLATDLRCHALTFTFTGTDPAALDAAERALADLTIAGEAPACVKDYRAIVARTEPAFSTQRYNTIPVRVLVDAEGNVQHVHILSAFPEQSDAILAALRAWRFQPYEQDGHAIPVETGLVFGVPAR